MGRLKEGITLPIVKVPRDRDNKQEWYSELESHSETPNERSRRQVKAAKGKQDSNEEDLTERIL